MLCICNANQWRLDLSRCSQHIMQLMMHAIFTYMRQSPKAWAWIPNAGNQHVNTVAGQAVDLAMTYLLADWCSNVFQVWVWSRLTPTIQCKFYSALGQQRSPCRLCSWVRNPPYPTHRSSAVSPGNQHVSTVAWQAIMWVGITKIQTCEYSYRWEFMLRP